MLFFNLAFYLEGRYLKTYEREFLLKVEEDVRCFIEKSSNQSFLLFPPLRSRLRYLAHKFLEEYFFPDLCSFSVGPEEKRIIIVGLTSNVFRCSLPYECIHKKIFYVSKIPEKLSSCTCLERIKLLLHQDSEFASFMSACGYLDKVTECNYSVKKMSQLKERSAASLKDRHRRPDKQLYVPRALRRNESETVSVVKEEEESYSVSSSKKHQKNENCKRNIQSSVIDKTANDEVSLNKDKSILKTELKVNEKSLDKMNTHHSDVLSKLKTELEFNEKSLDKVNSHHSDVLSSDLDVRNLEKLEISCKINLNDQERQCIGSTVVSTDMRENNDSKTDLENASLNECGNTDILCKVQYISSETSSQDEPANYTKLCSDYIDNSSSTIQSSRDYDVMIKTKDIGGKDCAEQTIVSAENEVDSWETMFNDDGDCLDPKFVEELCDITGRIPMTVAKNDYSDYQPMSENASEEYSNIVELYGFPVEFSTQDLTSAFSVFQETSYSIKWVDDCHALAIFSSPVIANQALHLNHPFIKVRPLSEGIKESKEKARYCARLTEAYKPRPVTTAVLARRLVTGALGLKVHTSKEQRDIERNMLKEAREKRKLKAKQRQDIWDGIVS